MDVFMFVITLIGLTYIVVVGLMTIIIKAWTGVMMKILQKIKNEDHDIGIARVK